MKHSLAAQMQTTLAPVVKKRVAAYARVSTEHEEQQTSYDAQVDYYTQKIKERTDWVFVEVYTEMLTKTKARCCTHRAFFAPKNQFLHPNAPIAKRKGYCKISADEAATAIAQFANVTRMAQTDFGRFGSALVDLGNNFATTESAIMNMATRLAAAGSQIGLTQPQILGFATALSSVGLEAEAGGTAFSKAMIQMQVAVETGNESLKDFAKVAGMTTDEFKAMWKSDPAGAIEAFIVGLSKMDEQGISAIATLEEMGLTEVRLRDTLLRATNATELFSEAQETANEAWEENVALTNEASKRYATTESKLKNLKNTAVLAAQRIGDDLNPTIQNLIDGAKDLLEKFIALDEEQRLMIIKLAAIAAAAGPTITVFSKIVKVVGSVSTGFGKFATSVASAGGGWKGFMSVLGKSPATWLAVAAAVVVATVAIADYVSGAQKGTRGPKGNAGNSRCMERYCRRDFLW